MLCDLLRAPGGSGYSHEDEADDRDDGHAGLLVDSDDDLPVWHAVGHGARRGKNLLPL